MKYVGLLVLIALTLGSGWLQGRMTHRWGNRADFAPLVKRLDTLEAAAEAVGNWQREDSQELAQLAADELQCKGYKNYTYRHTLTGQHVSMALLLGPPGPTSVHVPEICYSSTNHTQLGDTEATSVEGEDGVSHQFWRLAFRHNESSGGRLSVYYAWSDGGPFEAPSQPRLTYGGRDYLYKIQLAANVMPGAEEDEADPVREFLKEFLPVVSQALVPPEGQPTP